MLLRMCSEVTTGLQASHAQDMGFTSHMVPFKYCKVCTMRGSPRLVTDDFSFKELGSHEELYDRGDSG